MQLNCFGPFPYSDKLALHAFVTTCNCLCAHFCSLIKDSCVSVTLNQRIWLQGVQYCMNFLYSTLHITTSEYISQNPTET